MKKILFSLGIVAITASVFYGCKKDDDTTPPTITILGDNPYKIAVNGTFNVTNDPGATADDDGKDATADIVVDYSSLDLTRAGEYEVHYTVSDDADNVADEHRIMYVTHTGAQLNVSWPTITDNCDAGGTSFDVSTVGSDQYAMSVDGLFDGLSDNVVISMEANRLTIASQPLFTGAPSQTISGSGTIAKLANGHLKVILDYTVVDSSVPVTQDCGLTAETN